MQRISLGMLLLFGGMLVGAVAASPYPTPVCGYCGESFASAAEEYGHNVTVEHSTATVQVHENGTATWIIRNRLSRGAGTLQNKSERLAESLQTGYWSGLPDEDETTGPAIHLQNDTVVVRLQDPDAAKRHAGRLVVDYLHDNGGRPLYYINADRFTIRGPPGTVVTNEPKQGTVDGRNATWNGSTRDGGYPRGKGIDGSPYVVFGPDHSAGTQIQTTVALALATLPIVVDSLQMFVLGQTIFYGFCLWVVIRYLDWRPDGGRPEVLFAGLLTASTVGIGAFAITGLFPLLTIPLCGLGFGLLVWNENTRNRIRRPRQQALVGSVLIGAVTVLEVLLLSATGTTQEPFISALRASAIAIPFVALVPLGGMFATSRPRRLWIGLAALTFAFFAAGLINPADPPGGLGGGLVSIFLLCAAFPIAILGIVPLRLGQIAVTDLRE